MKPHNELPWETPVREHNASLRDHIRFFKEALLHLLVHVVTTFFVILLVGVAIALPSGLWVVRDYLSYADLVWPAERGFNVFFNDSATDVQIDLTAQMIKNHAFVADVFSIPKSAALREFLEAADLPDIANGMIENPLPNALTVYVKDGIQEAEVEQLTGYIRDLDTIDQVSYNTQIIVRFSAIYSIFNRMLWVVGGMFCIFALFVAASAVRIAIEERLHEIRILHVIGSPRRVIRGPFLWCGLMYGTLGGIFAAALLTMVLMYVEEPLTTLAESYGVRANLRSLAWPVVGVVSTIGASLGLSSAYYATWRHIQRVTKNWVI